jgi:cytochrome c-type biogenesis protein CcmH
MILAKAPSLSLPRSAGEGTLAICARREGANVLPLPRKRGRVGEGAFAAVFLAACLSTPAHAVTPAEKLADPALEARARVITGELRCLVCQNQSVDDSDAPLAKDLRVLVREKLKDGLSDAQVKSYVHDRYGDFVLLRPPVKIETLLLWTAPLLALVAGAVAVWRASRRRKAPAGPATLTTEEREKLKRIRADFGDV